jgi:hypothetical protein
MVLRADVIILRRPKATCKEIMPEEDVHVPKKLRV